MDPINLLVIINFFVSMSANWNGAKKGLKTSVTKVVERPKSYLQKVPPYVSTLVLIFIVIGAFKFGVLGSEIQEEYLEVRVIGLLMYFIFSWLQVKAYKSLGDSYTQDIVILKNHKLHKVGLYKFIRHPQYLSQILSDLGAGIALMSYLVAPAVLIFELPLFIMRAILEERTLGKHFKNEFVEYKKRSGFMLPFIG